MVRRFVSRLALILSLASCAAPPQPASSPAPWPDYLRRDLVPRWISAAGVVSWPPDDGCAAAPVSETLRPGTLIDRFGRDGGSFFSPKGESFAARAVPYVCRQMDYWVYQVTAPLPVKSCKAAPWFGSNGGATQYETERSAAGLVANGSLKVISDAPGGSPGPAPQCGDP